MTMIHYIFPSAPRTRQILLVSFLGAVAGCDWSVTNPGPVQDEFLDADAAHVAVVNGAKLALSQALGDFAYISSEPPRELTTAGRVYPVKLPANSGLLTPEETNRQWNLGQQARWVAEDAVRRLQRVRGNAFISSALAAPAFVTVGFANRLLGENHCEAVIDGGAPQSHTVYFERAQAAFTQALDVARAQADNEMELAALAGRASVLLHLGDWTGAVADARLVPDGFSYQARFSTAVTAQHNVVYFSNTNAPYRAHTVWSTPQEAYYANTGDPRVRWDRDPARPFGEISNVPWYFQLKHASRDAPIKLASGREMRLLEAEALLREGDWQEAVAIMNKLRSDLESDATGEPLPGLVALNAQDAWRHLQRERGLELWLEARRLGDIRRWIGDGRDGTFHPLEEMSGRSVCFPIAQSERQTNPNVR